MQPQQFLSKMHPSRLRSQTSSFGKTELLTVSNLGLQMNAPFFPLHWPRRVLCEDI